MIKKNIIPLLILLFSILTTYSNNLENEFLWDDEFLIQKNKFLTDSSFIPQMLISNSTAGFGGKDNFYRPTQNLFYFLVYQGFGLDPIAFHLGNILIHLLNAILLYFLFIKLFKNPFIAFSGSLLWGLHPAHVEAVTYISGTADPLSVFFFLLTLLTFPTERKPHFLKQTLLSVLFFCLALLSKEALIIAPAMLCLVAFWQSTINSEATQNKMTFRYKTRAIPAFLFTVPHWLIAFLYLWARNTFLNFNNTFDFYKTTNLYTENILFRTYTYLATIPEYLKILMLPMNLHMERSFPVHVHFFNTQVLMGLLIVILSFFISLAFFYFKKIKEPLFCWFWFFIAFVPMNGILLPVNSFILEHWLYLPSMSFFIFIGFILSKFKLTAKRLPQFILVAVCFYFSYFTHIRNRDWKDPITFYSNILKYTEGSARVHNNIAMAYSDKELWSQSIQHYKRAIDIADNYAQTHYNLARVYIQTNNHQLALKHLERSLEIDPQFSYSIHLKEELLRFINNKR